MVDALRRARHIVRAGGVVIDLHPTPDRARLEVGEQPVGYVESHDGPMRHAAAQAVLETAVQQQLFVADQRREFLFHTCAGSVDELADHIAVVWKTSWIDEPTLRRARAVALDDPRAAIRATERVVATRLQPLP